MPNIRNRNSNNKQDIIDAGRVNASLGANLDWRTKSITRVNRHAGTNFKNYSIRNYSHLGAGTITTTRRTFGMPIGSAINIGTYPDSEAQELMGQIASTSTNDVGVTGTGLREVQILGLDIYWEPLSASGVQLNGQTPVDISSLGFMRINKIWADETGSLGENEGDIYISSTTDTFVGGLPQNDVYYAVIAGENNSTFGHISFGAHIRNHFVTGNTYTNATMTNPFLYQEKYNFASSTGQRQGSFYSAGPLWITKNDSFSYEGSAPNFQKTDQTWIVNTAAGTVEGSMYYHFADQDQTYDHFDVYTA